MKRFLIMALCLLTLGFAADISAEASAQRHNRSRTVKGSGRVVTEKYNMRRFDGIRSSNGIDVEVSRGSFSIRVTTDRNVLKHLKIEVDNGILNIGYKNRINVRNVKTTVYISMPEIESLKVSSGSDIELIDDFSGRNLEVKASSAGRITGFVDYNHIEADASSGGDIRLRGRANKCEAEASSGASADLSGLSSDKAEAQASSGGVVSVCVAKSLTGKASSGGAIRYAGDPRNIDVRTSSGGSARAIQQRR